MNSSHIISPCHLTKTAIYHLLEDLALSDSIKSDLLVIDLRYDSSLIDLLLRLNALKLISPLRRCFFIVDKSKNKLPIHLTADYIDGNDSIEKIRHKICMMLCDNHLLNCWGHYSRLIRTINLTGAQIRVAREITQGLNTHQIARKHTLSVKTIYSHASAIKKKLNISNRHNLFHYLSENTESMKTVEHDLFNRHY
jgi:DNA-binding NarL/FixJ family response regulator